MLKEYEIKDLILKLLVAQPEKSFITATSVSEYLKISHQRAKYLLEAIHDDAYCKGRNAHGMNDKIYQYNEDTQPFLSSGGYANDGIKLEKKERFDLLGKEFIYKARWLPYLISLFTLLFTIWVYFNKPQKTQQEKLQEQLLIELTTRNKVVYLMDSLFQIEHKKRIADSTYTPTVGQGKKNP